MNRESYRKVQLVQKLHKFSKKEIGKLSVTYSIINEYFKLPKRNTKNTKPRD